MLTLNEAGTQWLTALAKELDWLEREHPERQALAGVARARLEAVYLASGWRPCTPTVVPLFTGTTGREGEQ